MDKIINNPFFNLIISWKPESSEQKRLFFSLALALLLHLIILSIHFTSPPKIKKPEQQLDIILTPKEPSMKNIENADYLSQSNQQGGGNFDKKKKTSNVIPLLKKNLDSEKLIRNDKRLQSKLIKAESKSSLSTEKISEYKASELKNKITSREKNIRYEEKQIKTINKSYIHNLKQEIWMLLIYLLLQSKFKISIRNAER